VVTGPDDLDMAKLGLDGALACGPQHPFYKPAAQQQGDYPESNGGEGKRGTPSLADQIANCKHEILYHLRYDSPFSTPRRWRLDTGTFIIFTMFSYPRRNTTHQPQAEISYKY